MNTSYTKEEALLDCFDIWIWMAVSGSRFKTDCPYWEENKGRILECEYNCPICEYVCPDCDDCIIPWSSNLSCEDEDSEYNRWCNCKDKKERSKWALEIAILALEELYNLWDENSKKGGNPY